MRANTDSLKDTESPSEKIAKAENKLITIYKASEEARIEKFLENKIIKLDGESRRGPGGVR